MFALNFAEICLIALWGLGVIAAIVARRSTGYGPRYFAIITIAVFVPVVGSIFALINLAMVRHDRSRIAKNGISS
ncbi:hypothetical protein BI49514_02065 [Brevibacterium iodinum ATCC 49514]|uniref:Phospholipase_D-nuclease N-terminal n=1 Tax=Brevibacterium iodinum ATCC 49514 TaxID=1255616 RepID=A0A2H1JJV2_9MICO|nr:hypothetical protein BI49514_02065 [Brevibacterium iodinum ATCC 49514]SUW14031.1 Uncharacterised protein [Brevibacterium iodinum]